MVRAAAKNHAGVAVVVDPADYAARARRNCKQQRRGRRRRRASRSRARRSRTPPPTTARSRNYLTALDASGSGASFPTRSTCSSRSSQDLRYGENPHQSAAFYRDARPGARAASRGYRQLQGKELSYNNIADADAAWECVKSVRRAGLRHRQARQPVRRRDRRDAARSLRKAFTHRSDVGVRRHHRVQPRARRARRPRRSRKQFVEVVIAPRVERGRAARRSRAKANVRVLEVPLARDVQAHDFKRVGGGLLVQSADVADADRSDLQVVTQARSRPTRRWTDLLFAWRVAKFVKSNAIVFCARRHDARRRRGPDEPRRLRAHRRASRRRTPGLSLHGSVGRLRRVLPVPRRPRRGRRRRRRAP